MHSSKNKKLQKYSAKNISKNPENSWCEESTDITSTEWISSTAGVDLNLDVKFIE